METTAVDLKWYQTLLFLFQTALFVADTTTNILTSLVYREQGHQQWFAVSLGLTIITLVALCIWFAMVSRRRLLSREREENSVGVDNPDNISLNNRVDIEKERLYNLYLHTLILGLLQAASQLIIQYYVYITLKEGDDVIPEVSMWISFITLTWMVTSMEVFRPVANLKPVPRLVHKVIIFLSNAGIIMARVMAIVCFIISLSWWIVLVLGVHCFIINFTGFLLWRSNRKQDMLVFIFAYSPLYLFSYSSYYLRKLGGNAPFSLTHRAVLKFSWYVLFTLENAGMILGIIFTWPYSYEEDPLFWFPIVALMIVPPGNLGGILLKLFSWYCLCGCFHEQNDEYWESVQRVNTLGMTTGLAVSPGV